MCNLGVVVCEGMSAVDPRLHDVIAVCLSAQLAHHAAECKEKLAKPSTLSS